MTMYTWKKTLLTMLALVLVVTPMVGNASAKESVTHASITFVEGVLEWDDNYPVGSNGMELDFGSRELPVDAVTYTAQGSTYTLQVKDARSKHPKWEMTVGMTMFREVDKGMNPAFSGVITMGKPTASHSITYADPLTIVSGESGIAVMSTDPSARALFSLNWAASDVKLALSETAAKSVMDTDYEATLTWTLATVV